MGTRIKSVRGRVGKASSLHAGGTTGFPTDIRGLKTAEYAGARPRIGRDLRWRKLSFPRSFYLVWSTCGRPCCLAVLFYNRRNVQQDVVPYTSRPALQRPAIRCSTISGCHQIANSSRGSLAMSGLCIRRVWRASLAAAF